MRIVVTGSTGLIGRALIPVLQSQGHSVTRLVRKQTPAADEIAWNPAQGKIPTSELEGFDAVVHLAGESIVGRWTAAKKVRIRESRVEGTRLLSEALAQLRQPPQTLVSASATGYYGNQYDEVMTETSSAGVLFLSSVCVAWEEATEPAARHGIRVVNPRIGFVLSGAGGGLSAMLPPFKMGVGGRVGNGRQYLSWIAIDDVVGVILHALTKTDMSGPVNTVAPFPVTNAEFTRALGEALHRPTVFPLPAFAARLVFGEMADNLLLASTRVNPARLLASGYAFRFPKLPEALRHVLGK